VTSEIKAVFIGAGIALAGGTVGAFLQHFLSLRTDRIKRERDRQEQESSREQDRQEEKIRWVRDKQNEVDKIEVSRKAREIERLREVLLESVSTRLAPQDLERFLQEVERKHDEDGLRWAERSRAALENWLTERLEEAIQESSSQEERPAELSD
jgi:uncharacterized membrane protein YhiD involved in acid resistance